MRQSRASSRSRGPTRRATRLAASLAVGLGVVGGLAAQDLDLEAGLGELLEEEAELLGGGETVSTGGSFAARVDRTPSNLYVITSEQLRALNPKHPAEALNMVPGFTVMRRNQRAYEISAFGTGWQFSNKVLILVDGHRVTDPAFGNTYWKEIPVHVDDVERIEVALGPESVNYGSNAFSAVVNFITRRTPSKENARVTARFGENGYHGVSAERTVPLEDGAGYTRVFAFDERQGDQDLVRNPVTGVALTAFPDGDIHGQTSVRLQHERRLDDQTRLHVSIGGGKANEDEASMVPAGDFPVDSDIRSANLLFDLDRETSPTSSFHIKGTVNAAQRVYSPPIFKSVRLADDDLDSLLAELELRVERRYGSWKVAGGALGRRLEVSGYLLGNNDEDGNVSEVFARGEREFGDDFVLYVGARKTFTDFTDDPFAWKVAGLWRPRPDTGIRLSVGSSFRAPDLVPLRLRTINVPSTFPTNMPLTSPNPNLESETARNFIQAGYERRWDDARFKLDLYTAELEGIIDLQVLGPINAIVGPLSIPTGQNASRFVNTPDTKVRGATMAYDRNLGEFRANLGLNFQERSGGTTQQLPLPIYAPDTKASLMVYKPIPEQGWGGSLLINAVSDYAVDNSVQEIRAGQAAQVDGYATLDVNVTRAMGEGLEAGLTVKNLLDEEHNEIVNTLVFQADQALLYGREAYVTVRKAF